LGETDPEITADWPIRIDVWSRLILVVGRAAASAGALATPTITNAATANPLKRAHPRTRTPRSLPSPPATTVLTA
jgi:hypothetical protein